MELEPLAARPGIECRQAAPYPRRQHDPRTTQSDLAEIARAAKVWNGPAALGTLASVFAALPLADEPALSAADIHARVAAWSPHCIRHALRALALAGIAEVSRGARVHPVTVPPNLYRRAATGGA